MKEATELANLIRRGENRCAREYIAALGGKSFCNEYSDALSKVILIKAAEELSSSIPAFYADTQGLAERLFKNNSSVQEELSFLSETVKDAAREDKGRACLKAKSYIESNFCRNQFSLKEAASCVGMTQSALTGLFLDTMGITPIEYVARLRVKKGETLLAEGKSVSLAAAETGFSGAESFIRTFKKYNGLTPGEWKRNKLFL